MLQVGLYANLGNITHLKFRRSKQNAQTQAHNQSAEPSLIRQIVVCGC